MSEIIYERAGLQDSTHGGEALINSGRFAFLLFLGADVMLFAGLIGGYVVLHVNTITWPPPGSPKLDVNLMLWTCPLLLLAFLGLMYGARASTRGNVSRSSTLLAIATAALIGFLLLNAIEWIRLFRAGLQIKTIFGGIYLIDMGAFLLHIVVGLGILLATIRGARTSINSLTHLTYYFFVLLVVWLTLFSLVYV